MTTEVNGNTYKFCNSCITSSIPNVLNDACSSCGNATGSIIDVDQLQKKIWNQVRVPSSLYIMNLAAVTVNKRTEISTSNQASDRNEISNQKKIVPSRGNSIKSSLTRIRPGSLSPGGLGVDVKHNSYARYLSKKKGTYLNTQKNTLLPPLYGNKTKMVGILNQCVCP